MPSPSVGMLPPGLGIVVGLKAEARLAALVARPELIAVSGATADGARTAVASLIARRATHLLSFGFAAGLDPCLSPGTVLVPREIVIDGVRVATDASLVAPFGRGVTEPLLHSDVLVSRSAEKASLRSRTGCASLDMESGAVALAARDAGLPFAVLRAVCDPAGTTLPHAARIDLRGNGALDWPRVLRSILLRPKQLPALLRLGRDVRAATASLGARLEQARHTTGAA